MKAALLLAALVLAGCGAKEPVSKAPTDNKEVEVSEMFTHKGITVYRFYDGGRAVYFTSGGDTRYTHSTNQYCGKGCTRQVHVDVQALRGDK